MNLNLEKKIVLVCGSSKGIGLSIAEKFLSEKSKVILSSRNILKNRILKKKLSKKYNDKNFLILNCDFSKISSIKKMRNRIIRKFKKIDILITNSGLSKGENKLKENQKFWEESWNANFNTCIYPITLFINDLEKNQGSILCISSIAGVEYLPAPTSYSVAKSAINTLVKILSKKYGNKVRINAIAPGNIMFKGSVWDKKIKINKRKVLNYIKDNVPQKRFGTPQEVANLAIFLSSDKANFISGEIINIDGGQTNNF